MLARRLLPSDGLTGSNRVLVGLSRRFSNFPVAGVDRYELKVPYLRTERGPSGISLQDYLAAGA
jgi:hypothetical protein